jgi:hypothetical protein
MEEKIERIKTSLDIEEGLDLHLRSWAIQRIGWGLIFVVIAFALLGLFGNGVLSEMTLHAGGVSLRYERFIRFENDTPIEVTVSGSNDNMTVAFSHDFAEAFKVENINPEPAGQRLENGSMVYLFKTEGTGQATFFVSARRRGDVEYDVRVNATELHVGSLIYP